MTNFLCACETKDFQLKIYLIAFMCFIISKRQNNGCVAIVSILNRFCFPAHSVFLSNILCRKLISMSTVRMYVGVEKPQFEKVPT